MCGPKPRAFWSNVKIGNPEECWIWIYSRKIVRGNKTYGNAWRNGKHAVAHRVAWELTYGPIPNGLLVCHKCDNPPCVNPNHLFLGTYQDNATDCKNKGRRPAMKGEDHPMARLSEADIVNIRKRFHAAKNKAQIVRTLCWQHSITGVHIGRITQGRVWSEVKGPIVKGRRWLSIEEVKRIRAEYASGVTQTELARRYGAVQSVISRLVNRKTRSSIS